MNSKQEAIRLGEVAKLVTDKIELVAISKSNYVSTDNMLANFGGIEKANAIPRLKKVNAFQSGDILFSNIRTYFKKLWFANIHGGCSADVLVFRPKNNDIDNLFLYYVLKNDAFISYTVTTSKGTKMPRGDKAAILNYQFNRPTLSHQKKIAYVLSTLENKIEHNKTINQTLESIAQTIFKSWFMDFDPVHAKSNANSEDEYDAIAKELGISRETLDLFPSEFEESKLGLIPKGWSIESFSTFANMKTKSVKPYNHPEKVWVSYSIPAFDSNGYPEICLGSEIKSNKYKVENGAILVSKLNPNTPRVWLTNKISDNAICSTEFMQFIPQNITHRPFIYCLINSEYFQNEIQSRVTGTTGSRQRAQPKEIAVISVINPTLTLIDRFSKIVNHLLEKILISQEEDNNLKQIQKILLPKLLSNEIDVSNLNLDPEHD